MKYGQLKHVPWLKEHNVRNVFLQKSCRKWGRETNSRSGEHPCRSVISIKLPSNLLKSHFELLCFLVKPFSYITKKVRTKILISSEQEKALGEIKNIFHHFKRTFNFQKLSKTWKVAFKCTLMQIWKSPYMIVCM